MAFTRSDALNKYPANRLPVSPNEATVPYRSLIDFYRPRQEPVSCKQVPGEPEPSDCPALIAHRFFSGLTRSLFRRRLLSLIQKEVYLALIAANVFRRSHHHCQLRNEHSRGHCFKVWWQRYISSWIVNWNEWNLPIHVPPRLYIVKSIHHKILRLKKFIRVKRFFCLWTNYENSQEEASKPIKPCRCLTSNKNNRSY